MERPNSHDAYTNDYSTLSYNGFQEDANDVESARVAASIQSLGRGVEASINVASNDGAFGTGGDNADVDLESS